MICASSMGYNPQLDDDLPQDSKIRVVTLIQLVPLVVVNDGVNPHISAGEALLTPL